MPPSNDDVSEMFEAIQQWLDEEYKELPEGAELRQEDDRYFIELETEFDPDRFVEMLDEDPQLYPDWIDRDQGIIGAIKEEEVSRGIVNRAAYGTTFHEGYEITLSASGPPITDEGDPVDDAVGETLELLSRYLRYE